MDFTHLFTNHICSIGIDKANNEQQSSLVCLLGYTYMAVYIRDCPFLDYVFGWDGSGL